MIAEDIRLLAYLFEFFAVVRIPKSQNLVCFRLAKLAESDAVLVWDSNFPPWLVMQAREGM